MKTNWKKTLDKDWIGTYILPDEKPIRVTLSNVKEEDIKVAGHSKHSAIGYFKENPYFDKPMIISQKVNLERLEEITGSKYIEDWVDVEVILQQEWDKTPKGGKCWGLRIVKIPELTPEHESWNPILEWIKKDEKNKIEIALRMFKISDENLTKLKEECQAK